MAQGLGPLEVLAFLGEFGFGVSDSLITLTVRLDVVLLGLVEQVQLTLEAVFLSLE